MAATFECLTWVAELDSDSEGEQNVTLWEHEEKNGIFVSPESERAAHQRRDFEIANVVENVVAEMVANVALEDAANVGDAVMVEAPDEPPIEVSLEDAPLEVPVEDAPVEEASVPPQEPESNADAMVEVHASEPPMQAPVEAPVEAPVAAQAQAAPAPPVPAPAVQAPPVPGRPLLKSFVPLNQDELRKRVFAGLETKFRALALKSGVRGQDVVQPNWAALLSGWDIGCIPRISNPKVKDLQMRGPNGRWLRSVNEVFAVFYP